MPRNRKQRIKKNLSGGVVRNDPINAPKGGGGRKKGRGGDGFTDPLTRKQARKMAGSQARAEYAPVVRGAKANVRASRNREREVNDWFNQLGGQIQQSAANTDARYSAANAAMMANIQAAQQAAAQNQQNVASQDAQFAALTGADPGSFSDTAATMNAGAQQRAVAQSALAAPIAAAGAAQGTYLENTGINAGREKIHQRLTERKRRRAIKQDLTAARKERAQKAQGNFREIRNEERDYGIQRAAFKLDQQNARLDARSDAADRRQRQRENEEDNAQDERGSKRTREGVREGNQNDGKGGLTPSQRRDIKEGNRNAMNAATTLYKAAGRPNWSNKEWTVFIQRVAMEEGIDYTEAKRAVNRLRKRINKRRRTNTYNPNQGDTLPAGR